MPLLGSTPCAACPCHCKFTRTVAGACCLVTAWWLHVAPLPLQELYEGVPTPEALRTEDCPPEVFSSLEQDVPLPAELEARAAAVAAAAAHKAAAARPPTATPSSAPSESGQGSAEAAAAAAPAPPAPPSAVGEVATAADVDGAQHAVGAA